MGTEKVTIREINEEELSQYLELMKELRPQLDAESFRSFYNTAKNQNKYSLHGLFMGSQCLALMGYRIMTDFVHGRHLYIDDLVVKKDYRSQGLGAQLLKFAENAAKEEQCTGLRLCTGVENQSGKKFYEKEGWNLRAVVYKKKLPANPSH